MMKKQERIIKELKQVRARVWVCVAHTVSKMPPSPPLSLRTHEHGDTYPHPASHTHKHTHTHTHTHPTHTQELLMHDALSDRTGIVYEEYTPEMQDQVRQPTCQSVGRSVSRSAGRVGSGRVGSGRVGRLCQSIVSTPP